jgi:hypothetical protein
MFVKVALVILSLFVSVSAFSPKVDRSRSGSTAINAKSKSVPFLEDPKNLGGMIGNKGFDPIGFSDVIDPRYLREAELKHCRVAMLGTLGKSPCLFMYLKTSL